MSEGNRPASKAPGGATSSAPDAPARGNRGGARIVADIGGTNGRFAIVRDGEITERREYRNAEFSDLASLFARYLDDAGSADDGVEAACLAVAAPLTDDGVAKFTNAPWEVSASALQSATGLSHVALINDFAAQAYGLLTLRPDDVVTVAPGKGERPHAARLILGPGTGLGCAALVPTIEKDGPAIAVTSEGGHMGFVAETDADQIVLAAARAKYGRTSWERVCCGSGLALVHRALHPDDALPGVAEGDPTAVVERARADRDSAAARSVVQYSGMLGAFAGDLALVFNAAAGVHLTGGVLGHLGDAFDTGAFLERFVAKGRYREWLSALAVVRIVADGVALRGCAQYLEQTMDVPSGKR